MRQVLDKNLTYQAAARAGVPMPRSIQPTSSEELRRAAAALSYPVVLKWADPNAVIQQLEQAGLACEKLRYCHSAEELLSYLAPYEAIERYPLIQEYCAGYGLGQFLLMRDGQPLCAFQHRRLHEWPPEGGVSTQCISVPLSQHSELLKKSVALLQELCWDGIAMVEYRYDPLTETSKLMEINGRFWGSLPLACQAGVAFPWLLYLSHGLQLPIHQPAYQGGVRCRFMIPETRRLLRLLLKPGLVADRQLKLARGAALWDYLRDCLRPRMRYFVFDWGDPAPLWHDLSHALLRRR
jgi:predicted ATP-grasp superfamily ATP-dependent carboligase